MDLTLFSLPFVVLTPFIGALIVAWVARWHRIASAGTAFLLTLLALIGLVPSILALLANTTPIAPASIVQSWEWIPHIGLTFAFRLDGLSLLFAGMILLIGLLVIIYARYYLTAKDSMGRFYAYLLLFMGSMLGVVLSENLLQLLVFWELTSLSSFLLISYWQYRQDARRGARMALTITGMGGLALLAGVLLLGEIVGSYNLSVVLAAGEQIRSHEWYLPTLVLILMGVFTKSAQFPFHFWLPHAMAAPTPVSAYLHSATMVKAGIFLLARLFPALSGSPEWHWLVTTVGLLTLLLGAFTALFKHDIKALLAYSTISHLGLITLLFGIGTQLAAVAAIFHIINHATFKASLFMVAGIVDHETGTRDMRRINGMLKYMPHTAVLAMIAASAMAGVPLLNGFLSKEMFFDQALAARGDFALGILIPILATVAGIFSVAYSLRFIHDVFFNGEPIDLPKTPHEPPRYMKIPVDLLVILCIAVGVFPAYTVAPLLSMAVHATLQTSPPEYSLAIWHGFNVPLLMSFLALIGGVAVYLIRHPLFAWYERTLDQWDARKVFNALIRGLLSVAITITRRFDKGSLQHMLLWLLMVAIGLGSVGFYMTDAPLFGNAPLSTVDPVAVVAMVGLILASLLTVEMHRSRMISLIMLGVVGLVVSLGFAKFSAPDLALTQLSVEVVTVVLLMLALYFLPQYTTVVGSTWRRGRDLMIASAAGISVAILALAVLSRESNSRLADFFVANSVPGGGGHNVVNVILVDFRGFDTLGEIVVLALAGLGIFALLENIRLYAPERDAQGRLWDTDRYPLMLRTQAQLLFPMMLLLAVFVFLRGHNLPGGGFIAGLIAALAIILQNLANGISWTAARLKVDMHTTIALGLLFALSTGLAALLFGYPFLTSTFTHLQWPIVGEFEIASAMGFDFGVFLVVVGSTVLMLVQLGKLNYLQIEPAATLKENN